MNTINDINKPNEIQKNNKKTWINIIILLSIITGIIIIFYLIEYFGLLDFLTPFQGNFVNIGIYLIMFGITTIFIIKDTTFKKIGFISNKILINIGIGILGSSGFLIAAIIFMQTPNIMNLITIFIILILSLLVGLTEESIFRGYIQQKLNESYKSIWSILITALLFAAIHMPRMIFELGILGLVGLFSFTQLGIIFGYYRKYLNNMTGVIILHAFWDYWLLIFAPLNLGSIPTDPVDLIMLLSFLLTGLGLAFGLLLSGLLITWKLVDHTKEDFTEFKRDLSIDKRRANKKISNLKKIDPEFNESNNLRLRLESKMKTAIEEFLKNSTIDNFMEYKNYYKILKKIKKLILKHNVSNPAKRLVIDREIKHYESRLPQEFVDMFEYP
ncbi:MAG: CPBP family intramembrane metalloprotease [Candidatus Lokiarchaeota archaeon]|nr:CPBP family intramembrane metalloprotease [Candidatus Lokiarchaeota archaeon]